MEYMVNLIYFIILQLLQKFFDKLKLSLNTHYLINV